MKDLFLNQHAEVLIPMVLEAWAGKGHKIGVDEHLQLRVLVGSLPDDTTPERLKTLITPLLVKDVQQQDDFYELFDNCIKILESSSASKSQMEERSIIQMQRQGVLQALQQRKNKLLYYIYKNRNWAFLSLLLIVGGALAIWLTTNHNIPIKDASYRININGPTACLLEVETGHSIEHFKKITEQTSIFEAHQIKIENTKLKIYASVDGTGLDKISYLLSFADGTKELWNINIRADLFTRYSPIQRTGVSTQHKPNTLSETDPSTNAQNNKPLDLVDTTNLMAVKAEQYSKPADVVPFQTESWQFGSGATYFSKEKAIILIGTLLGLLVLGYWMRNRNRRFSLKHPENSEPFDWHMSIPMRDELEPSDNLLPLLKEMRKRSAFESDRIDYPKTVSQTAKKAGMLQLEYKTDLLAKEYLVIVEVDSPQNHQARLYQQIIQMLQDWEAPIVHFEYDTESKLFKNKRFPKGISLRNLQHRHAESQLIWIGDAKDLLDPTDCGFCDAAAVLDLWKKKIVMTPVPVENWGKAEEKLTQKFKLLPATPKGFADMVETLESVEQKGFEQLKTQYLGRKQSISLPKNLTEEEFYSLFQAEFGQDSHGNPDDRFIRWIIGCAIPPVMFWDWTLYVGSLLSLPSGSFLNTDNYYQLTRISWFVDGEMPSECRKLLLDLGHKHYPIWMEKLAGRWQYALELEENLPPPGSLAWHHHRIHVILSQLLQKSGLVPKNKLEKELDALVANLPVQDALLAYYAEHHQRPLSKFQSDTIRKLVYRKQLSTWMVRDWVWQLPIILLVSTGTFFYHPIERVTSLAFNNHITALAFSPDSKQFAVANGQGEIGICDNTGNWLMGIGTQMEKILTLQYAANNELIAGSSDGGLVLWDKSGKEVVSYKIQDTSFVTAISFSPMLDTAFIGYFNGYVRIWDVQNNKPILKFKASPFNINELQYNPKMGYLAIAGGDGKLNIRALDGTKIKDLEGHKGEIHALDITADGKKLLTGGADKTVRLWDYDSFRPMVIKGHQYDVYDVHFSPDGKFLLSTSGGSIDNNGRLWNMEGKQLRKLGGHSHNIKASCFSKDNNLIITGDGDGNIRIWKTIAG